MQSTREIVTLQLGDYANHVATHYWNLEWENAKFHAFQGDSKQNEDDSNDLHNYSLSADSSSTNPSKRSRYLNLKNKSKASSSSNKHSGSPSITDASHRNIDPNICFHSSKQQSTAANSHAIKNKLEINKSIYSPRTIIFALQGSEGNIRSNVYDTNTTTTNSTPSHSHYTNTYNQDSNAICTWNNNVSVIQQAPAVQPHSAKVNKTENSSKCEFWSDYLLPSLHEKSLFALEGVHHFSTPFYSYSTGYDLLNANTTTSNELKEAMEDRIRWFVESCDWPQGFQLFASTYDSFSGFLPTLMHSIHDDYSNKCVLLYDCNPSSLTKHRANMYASDYHSNESAMQAMDARFKYNSIVALAQIWGEVSNIIPISVDHWHRTQRRQAAEEQGNSNSKLYNTSIIASCLHHYTNAARLLNSSVRLMDIVNCTVKMNAMKLSMLSSCSTHLDLDMNYQAIDCIEKLLMTHPQKRTYVGNSSVEMYREMNQPIFPRLACLGPIDGKYFSEQQSENEWSTRRIFGEYSCLNGSNLYETSPKVALQWKQNKMVLAQKQGSSKADIELFCDEWSYDAEREQYHFKLMTKLAAKVKSPLKWNLIHNAWKLPNTHPFYYRAEQQKRTKNAKNSAVEEEKEELGVEEEESGGERNRYSMWSSGWSSSLIGETYLNECAQGLAQLMQQSDTYKIFGDVELDLMQYKEDLCAWTDTYSPIEELDKK